MEPKLDRSKEMSHTVWKDPTRTVSRIMSFEKQLDKLFIEYKAALLQTIRPAEMHVHLEGIMNAVPGDLFTIDTTWVNKRIDALTESVLNSPAFAVIATQISVAYAHGNQFANQRLKAQIKIQFGNEMSPEARERIATLSEQSKTEFKGATDDMNKRIKRVISQGVLDKSSYKDVSKGISDAVDSVGRYRSAMIARTETMKAVNTAVKARYEEAGVTMVEWLAAEDERTCDECGDYDGQVYDLGDEPELPAHPNCRCTLIPRIVMKDSEEE